MNSRSASRAAILDFYREAVRGCERCSKCYAHAAWVKVKSWNGELYNAFLCDADYRLTRSASLLWLGKEPEGWVALGAA